MQDAKLTIDPNQYNISKWFVSDSDFNRSQNFFDNRYNQNPYPGLCDVQNRLLQ